jgi:hypothetical protein
MAPPTTISPVQEQELYIVKEATPGTIPSSVGSPVPFTSFKPSDKPVWLMDESFQGSMGDFYGLYQGPLIASFDVGGHVFGDHGLGEALYNLLGDYTATGTAGTGSTTLTAQLTAGATTATVASITGFSSGQAVQIGITADGIPEIVTLSAAPSGSTLTFANTPARFTHANSAAVAGVQAPYTHVFALLNGSTGAANGPGQPPTHCFTHRQGIAANGANQYAYGCFSEVVITGSAEKLFDWSGKGICASRVTAGSAVGFANTSSVQPYPSWRTQVGWAGPASGGTLIKTPAEHTITLSRAVKAMFTEQGSQQPYIIARGKQSNAGKLVISPAIDDSTLTAMLANTQPQLQFLSSNGLGGANLVSVQVDIILAGLETADIASGGELFGYDVDFKAIHTASTSGGISTTGASGGKGAVKVTLINNVATY